MKDKVIKEAFFYELNNDQTAAFILARQDLDKPSYKSKSSLPKKG